MEIEEIVDVYVCAQYVKLQHCKLHAWVLQSDVQPISFGELRVDVLILQLVINTFYIKNVGGGGGKA